MVSEAARAFGLRAFGREVPVVTSRADVAGDAVLVVPNPRSATRILALLCGVPLPAAPALDGLSVRAREGRASARPELPIPAAAEKLLRLLLEAIQPDTAHDELWLAVREQPEAGSRKSEATVLSVTVTWTGDAEAFDQTVFALACQRVRPFELVADAPATERLAVQRTLDAHAALGTFRVCDRATGRYRAFLDAGDLVYPQHYERLLAALEQTGAGWAVARGRSTTGAAGHVDTKVNEPERPNVAALLLGGSLPKAAMLFDGSRCGGLDVNPASGAASDAEALARRLLAWSRPAVLDGVPSWEHPAREQPPLPRESPLLLTLEELEAAVKNAPAPDWLRYRVADAVAEGLARAGKLGSLVRSIAGRWRKP